MSSEEHNAAAVRCFVLHVYQCVAIDHFGLWIESVEVGGLLLGEGFAAAAT